MTLDNLNQNPWQSSYALTLICQKIYRSAQTRLDVFYGWCSGRRRSNTVLTGLKVLRGTSTNTVFQ